MCTWKHLQIQSSPYTHKLIITYDSANIPVIFSGTLLILASNIHSYNTRFVINLNFHRPTKSSRNDIEFGVHGQFSLCNFFFGFWRKGQKYWMKTERTAFNEDHDHPLKPSAHHGSHLSFHLIRGHIIVASILLCPGRGYYYYPCSDM